MTLFSGIGIFHKKFTMTPKQLAQHNKNKREYEKKQKELEKQFKRINK